MSVDNTNQRNAAGNMVVQTKDLQDGQLLRCGNCATGSFMLVWNNSLCAFTAQCTRCGIKTFCIQDWWIE
jgi:MoaA/NifB/PqqE/SkfB family radical SAM enzyme